MLSALEDSGLGNIASLRTIFIAFCGSPLGRNTFYPIRKVVVVSKDVLYAGCGKTQLAFVMPTVPKLPDCTIEACLDSDLIRFNITVCSVEPRGMVLTLMSHSELSSAARLAVNASTTGRGVDISAAAMYGLAPCFAYRRCLQHGAPSRKTSTAAA